MWVSNICEDIKYDLYVVVDTEKKEDKDIESRAASQGKIPAVDNWP